MKKLLAILVISLFNQVYLTAGTYIPQNGESYTISYGIIDSFGPPADTVGSVAISMNDSRIISWATGYVNYIKGTKNNPILDKWTNPNNALGEATGSVYDIVCLGDGGQITLTFDKAIRNDMGFDFVVFENAFSDGFLELAYVEVSTDGINFLRFPNFYLGTEKMGAFDNYNYAELVYNLGSKYTVEYGTGYDLQELIFAYNYALNTPLSESSFSQEYTTHILSVYDFIDINNINYIRICDIDGDGNSLDSAGNPIYDPYRCFESPGLDLQAVGVINQIPEPCFYGLILGVLSLSFIRYRKRKLIKK